MLEEMIEGRQGDEQEALYAGADHRKLREARVALAQAEKAAQQVAVSWALPNRPLSAGNLPPGLIHRLR
jgi:hypothetical protein